MDRDDNTFELDGISFTGYYILVKPFSLNNDDEKIYLYDEDSLIDETDTLNDGDNDNKSWQFCNNEWIFIDSTKEKKNNCGESEEEAVEEDEEGNEEEESEEKPAEELTTQTEEPEEKPVEKPEEKPVEKPAEKKKEEPKTIQLNNPKNIKSYTVREYKSKTQYIKEYAIYGFALFCVFVIIYLLIKR